MLYFFYGPDTFRLKEKLNSVIKEYKTKHQSGLNLAFFDFEENVFSELKNFFDAYSMFAEKKLAVVRNLLESSLENKEKFLEFLAKSDVLKNKEFFLAMAEELVESDGKNKTAKYILTDEIAKKIFSVLTTRPAISEEFETLRGAKLENWVKKQAQKEEVKIEEGAVKKLIEFAGADLWRLKTEIAKLAVWQKDGLISQKDVDELVSSRVESDIFKTIDALAVRNKLAAFKFLHRHLSQGESEIYLLTMLTYQFRNLLLVKSEMEKGASLYALQKKLKLHPFVLRKSFEQAKNFSFSALKKIYERLQETDIAVKTGQVEGQAALDLLVAEIAG